MVMWGFEATVFALAVSGSDLYAGGYFTTAGGISATNIARWNGSSWTALGSGMNDQVDALAVSGSDLYAGGYFTTAGGKVSPYIVRAYLLPLPTLSVLRSGIPQGTFAGLHAPAYRPSLSVSRFPAFCP